MQKRVRYHRTHLYPYDAPALFLWSLPPISSSPLPLAPYPRRGKVQHRKIYLVPITPVPICYNRSILTSSRPLKGDEIPPLSKRISCFVGDWLLRFGSVFALTSPPQA